MWSVSIVPSPPRAAAPVPVRYSDHPQPLFLAQCPGDSLIILQPQASDIRDTLLAKSSSCPHLGLLPGAGVEPGLGTSPVLPPTISSAPRCHHPHFTDIHGAPLLSGAPCEHDMVQRLNKESTPNYLCWGRPGSWRGLGRVGSVRDAEHSMCKGPGATSALVPSRGQRVDVSRMWEEEGSAGLTSPGHPEDFKLGAAGSGLCSDFL